MSTPATTATSASIPTIAGRSYTSNGWRPVQPNGDVQNRLDQQREARDVGQQRFGNSAQRWQGRGGGFRAGVGASERSFGGGGGHFHGSALTA